jgi:hypothetical protein
MSRLRDDTPILPSYAAILRQQPVCADLEEPAHVAALIDDRFGAPAITEGQEPKQEIRWIIDEQEETLLYI